METTCQGATMHIAYPPFCLSLDVPNPLTRTTMAPSHRICMELHQSFLFVPTQVHSTHTGNNHSGNNETEARCIWNKPVALLFLICNNNSNNTKQHEYIYIYILFYIYLFVIIIGTPLVKLP